MTEINKFKNDKYIINNMISILLILTISIALTFFFISIIRNHLLFSIFSTISWIIITASSIRTEFVTGFSFTFSQTPVTMFFFGLMFISLLYTVHLILAEIGKNIERKGAQNAW